MSRRIAWTEKLSLPAVPPMEAVLNISARAVNAVLALAVSLVIIGLVRRWSHPAQPPLPPGPPGEFLIGHLRVVPGEYTAEAYAQWGKKYKSDVIYTKSLGQPVIVLNSVNAARELLDRRGAKYCDRPQFTLFEVMGWGMTLTFLPYGERWKKHRKLLQTTFNHSNVRQWNGLQTREARRTVRDIMRAPENWEVSLKRFAVAIVLKASYGIDVLEDDNEYIKIADDAMYVTGNGGAPAHSIVDIFPAARYLPDWLVRDWPLKFAREWGWAIQKLHDVPFAVAQREVAQGKESSSFAHRLLEAYISSDDTGLQQEWTLEDIKGAAGAIFIAGTDTTWATVVIFILNMVLNPEIQAKAQAQIDREIGEGRLPTLKDRHILPYIDWIVQETYRWSPLAPLGIPHRSLENDVYEGMFIPKGSIVFANSQAMTHDPRVYHEPHIFNPDRFGSSIEGGAGEPYPLGQFGFGRRICVGRFLADDSVWIIVATMLATLDFSKTVAEDGTVIEPRVKFTNGGTCHPEHFECSITARSQEATALIAACDFDEDPL